MSERNVDTVRLLSQMGSSNGNFQQDPFSSRGVVISQPVLPVLQCDCKIF